jgi:hypothetical protein
LNDRRASGREESGHGAYLSYLDRLSLSAAERGDLLERVANGERDPQERFAALHRALAGGVGNGDDAARASIRRRLGTGDREVPLTHDAHGRERLMTAPPLARSSMVPPSWSRGVFAGVRGLRDRSGPGSRGGATSPDAQGHWHAVGTFRRVVLLGLVVAQTYIATTRR